MNGRLLILLFILMCLSSCEHKTQEVQEVAVSSQKVNKKDISINLANPQAFAGISLGNVSYYEDGDGSYGYQSGVNFDPEMLSGWIDAYVEVYISDTDNEYLEMIDSYTINRRNLGNLEGVYGVEPHHRLDINFYGQKYINRKLFITFEKDGILYENIEVDRDNKLLKGLKFVRDDVGVGDTVSLNQAIKAYKVYSSAWEWIEDNPNYREAILAPGDYKVVKEYIYDQNKYINLEGIGWLYTGDEYEIMHPRVEFNPYTEDVLFEGNLNYSLAFDWVSGIRYSSYRVDVYVSEQFYSFNENEFVASDQKSVYFEPAPVSELGSGNTLAEFSDVYIEPVKGKYVNKKLYVSYTMDGIKYEDVLVDQQSMYYE